MSTFSEVQLFPADWTPSQTATLVYVLHEGSVLLIHKLRGHGAGKINAPGGRVEHSESVEDCAIRELFEEVGIRARSPVLAASLRFRDLENGFSMHGCVFVVEEFDGSPVRTAEADPFWCTVDQIPYDQMWEDDRFWLPHVLAGSRVNGDLVFANDKLKEWYLTVEKR